MSPESVLVIYFNLCAITLVGWLTTRRRGATFYGWRILSLMSAAALALLLTLGGLCVAWLALTFHGC